LVEEELEGVDGWSGLGADGGEVAGELGVHFEGFELAGDAGGGAAVFQNAVGLDELVVLGEAGGAGFDDAGEEGEFFADGEGGVFTGLVIGGFADVLDVGADFGVGAKAGSGAVGDPRVEGR